MASGKWELESIITHEFPLDKLEQAIRTAGDVEHAGNVVVLLSAAFPHPDNKPTPIVNISKVEIHFLLIQILPFLILYSTIVPYPLSCRKSQIQHKFSQIQLLILHKKSHN